MFDYVDERGAEGSTGRRGRGERMDVCGKGKSGSARVFGVEIKDL